MSVAKLALRGLAVRYRDGSAVLRDVGFDLAAGECLAVLGESGSGKSTLARTVIGLLPATAVSTGEMRFDGEIIDPALSPRLRGRRIGMVFQDAAASLHPLRRIGAQLDEALRRAKAGRTVADALGEVGLDASPAFAERYPHELSGGQRQRVMIALALAASPDLLIADEITSALDPLAAHAMLDLLARLQRERRLTMLFISHDLHMVRRIADRVLLLRHGAIDTLVDTATFFTTPPSDYARLLLAAIERGPTPSPVAGEPVLQVRALSADYGNRPALRDIDLDLPRGGALGVIGASGSGKSTLARVLLALQAGQARRLHIAGADPFVLSRAARKAWRRRVQIVFQDPGTALDPGMTVAETLREPLRLHGIGDAVTQSARVLELLAAVQLDATLAARHPRQLSGGQKQRVAIARALALEPELLVCDEAVSALDLSVQAEILALLRELQRARGLSLVFISHDLAAVRALCDRVLVLEQGRVVEQGTTVDVLARPRHAHTRALLAASA